MWFEPRPLDRRGTSPRNNCPVHRTSSGIRDLYAAKDGAFKLAFVACRIDDGIVDK